MLKRVLSGTSEFCEFFVFATGQGDFTCAIVTPCFVKRIKCVDEDNNTCIP